MRQRDSIEINQDLLEPSSNFSFWENDIFLSEVWYEILNNTKNFSPVDCASSQLTNWIPVNFNEINRNEEKKSCWMEQPKSGQLEEYRNNRSRCLYLKNWQKQRR